MSFTRILKYETINMFQSILGSDTSLWS